MRAGFLLLALLSAACEPRVCRVEDEDLTSWELVDPGQLARCEVLAGSLLITGEVPTAIAMPRLERVEGDLYVSEATSLRAITLSSLTEVTGHLLVARNPELAALDLPVLGHVGGELHVTGNAALAALSAPRLETVHQGLLRPFDDRVPGSSGWSCREPGACVEGNPRLEVLALGSLRAVAGTLAILDRLTDETAEERGAALGSIELEQLTDVESVRLVSPTATALRVPLLSTVPGSIQISAPELQEMELPLLSTAGGVALHAPLATVELPSLVETGQLAVGGLGALSAPRLERIDDALFACVLAPDVADRSVGELHLPALTSTGDLVLCGQQDLEVLSLPVLEEVRGALWLGVVAVVVSPYVVVVLPPNPALRTLDLPRLTRVAGGGLAQLGDPRLPAVSLFGLAALERIDLPLLEHLGGELWLGGADALRVVDLPRLATMDGALLVQDAGALEELELPSLTLIEGDLAVERNGALASLAFPALARIDGALVVRDNPALPTCAAEDLAAQVEAAAGIGGGADIGGNDDAASCP